MAGALRLDGDALPDAGRVDALADGVDRAGQLVAEDEGLLDDEVTDAAVAEVVHVGAADADGGDPDEHVAGVDGGDGAVLDGEASWAEQDADALGGGHAVLASSAASSRPDVWVVEAAAAGAAGVVAGAAAAAAAGMVASSQQVAEADLGGTAEQDVAAEGGRDDAEPVGHGGHRLRPHGGDDAVPDVSEQRAEEPAEHDDLGVDGVDGVPQCRWRVP